MHPDQDETNITPFPTLVADSAATAGEGLKLQRAFMRITNPADKRKVIALAEELAGPETDAPR